MKRLIIALLAIFLLYSPVSAETQYCTVKAEKFPCSFFVFIYSPDDKSVYWILKINPDGTQELVYEAETPSQKNGLKEAQKEGLAPLEKQ